MSTSMEAYDRRLGGVETNVASLQSDVAVLKRDTHDTKTDVQRIAAGVQQIIQQNAARGEGFTIKSAWQYAVAAAALFAAVYAFIANSPPFVSLEARITKLDDRDVGRVTRLEQEAREIKAWRTTVTVARQ